MTVLPISLYCVWQWWNWHYQTAHGRPDRIDFDWLDATWLGRTRQLYAWFGDLGIGQAEPEIYADMVRPHDIRFIERSAASQGMPTHCDLHHCNVPTEAFAGTYAAVPGLRSLQGSVRSDIRAIRAALPEVPFSGMVSPVDLINRPHADVLADIEHALAAGVNDLALWDMDPSQV